jgi:hypothetical protein
MIPREQREALIIARKGYRSPPRQMEPVFATDFAEISQETMNRLVERGLLETKSIAFQSGEELAYIVTAKGVKEYAAFSDTD